MSILNTLELLIGFASFLNYLIECGTFLCLWGVVFFEVVYFGVVASRSNRIINVLFLLLELMEYVGIRGWGFFIFRKNLEFFNFLVKLTLFLLSFL